MSDREQVLLERAYVLHQRPYRNTSMIVECLTERHGRQSFVAQGARRAERRPRTPLEPFRPLRVSWVRRGELGRLTELEAERASIGLNGDALLAGFYLNELLLRLLPRGDQNEPIYRCYSHCLDRLAAAKPAARAVRLFELDLLDALGYRVDL
ncbi:MAG: DNA repair protein RecO, partial [Gammaproteobacteria bacterium]|nr:DNA repair protein RecO [Gammaproteobacteria bacterium]